MFRISKDMMLIASAEALFAYVLFWLTRHSFLEQPHHYLTALVIVGWLASLPFVVFNTQEPVAPQGGRSKHHGYF